VLDAGIARVVAAMHDPNPRKAGGAARLREAGVAVEVGLLESEARELNLGFVSTIERARPWVRLKAAASLDGRTALVNGASQWITSEAARADGHAWRARACAILTGIGTVQKDDPALTVRAVKTPRQPKRIVVDRHAQTSPSARVLAGEGALLITAGPRNPQWPSSVESIAIPDGNGRVDLAAMMTMLGRSGILELHVEGGAKLNGALLEAGLVDEILMYVAPSVLFDPARGLFERSLPLESLASRVPVVFHDVRRIGDDLRIVARVTGG
jgi:diaminohydroxyphosphoribosylaminopyrimidine deaminase/5-amino-6-(5-phosphoribosylamino)uracil reductase